MAGTDIVPFSKYALAGFETSELLETIQANVGDQAITERNLDRVKMPSGGSVTWSVPTLEGDEDTKELVGVIIYQKTARAYWKTSFDESDGNEVPDCSSADATRAFPNADFVPPAEPMDEGSGYACGTCALAQFGSGKDGRGQACQMKRLVFMVTEKDVLPFVVALAPTSLKASGDYNLRLTRAGLPYWKVQTRITLEKHTEPKPHARAVMTKAGDIAPDEIAKIKAYRDALVPAFSSMRLEDAA